MSTSNILGVCCDRCGETAQIGEGEASKWEHVNAFAVAVPINGSSWSVPCNVDCDLCPDCAKELHQFMGLKKAGVT